jgi:hypothetical protein
VGVGVRGTTEGMSGLHMQAWRQGLGMGSWRVRFGWCESRAECLRGRLQVSMTRAGSICPGASMHAMYMHMNMRTLRSLIASYAAVAGLLAPYASQGGGGPAWDCAHQAHTRTTDHSHRSRTHAHARVSAREHTHLASAGVSAVSSAR